MNNIDDLIECLEAKIFRTKREIAESWLKSMSDAQYEIGHKHAYEDTLNSIRIIKSNMESDQKVKNE